jgi:hypothetical protein
MSLVPEEKDLIAELQRITKELEDLRFIASSQITSGAGLPNGGTTGQALVKVSTTDGDATWQTININTVTVGTTTTGNAGTNASVTNSGTANNLILNFTIPRGDTGVTGSAGADGKTILSGSGAPLIGTGTNGDFYLDTTNKNFYGPKSGGTWSDNFSLVGPQGPQGDPGPQGTSGNDLIAARVIYLS